MFRSALQYLAVGIMFSAIIMFGSVAQASTVPFWYFTGHSPDGTLATGAIIFNLCGHSNIGIEGPNAAHWHLLGGFFEQVGAYTVTGDLEFFVELFPTGGPPFTSANYDVHGFENFGAQGPTGSFGVQAALL